MPSDALARKRPSSIRQTAKNSETRRRLIEAAGKVVGERGYAGASIARITDHAGVAHGAFYLHFASRQALFEILLPELGAGMLDAISAAINNATSFADIERRGLKANFHYLTERPEIERITNEAELYAPASFHAFMTDLQERYLRSLKRSRRRGDIKPYTDEELRTIVALLAGARSYLLKFFARDGVGRFQSPGNERLEIYLDVFLTGMTKESISFLKKRNKKLSD